MPGPTLSPLSRAEIEEGLRRFPRWFYPHDLGQGIVVQPTDSQRGKTDPARFRAKHAPYWKAILQGCGGSLEGLRVLDAGCFEGYWTIEAAKAGAAEAVGFDLRPEHVEQARFVARAVGLPNARFEVCDLFDLERLGTFDVIFLFGVLYHVDRPVELLQKARSICRRLLVVNTKILPLDEPVLQVRYEDPGQELNAATHPLVMVPSASAVVRMMRHAGFREVGVVRPAADGNEAYIRYRRAVFLGKPNETGAPEAPPAGTLTGVEGRQGEKSLSTVPSAADRMSAGLWFRRKWARLKSKGKRPPETEAPWL
jgi:tRNA (mo5U34)-methyltransferase